MSAALDMMKVADGSLDIALSAGDSESGAALAVQVAQVQATLALGAAVLEQTRMLERLARDLRVTTIDGGQA